MSTHAPQFFRFSTALSLGLGYLLLGCGAPAVDDGDLDPSGDEAVGSDEAALYQGWAPAPQERLYVAADVPLHYCGDGVVATNEECDDGGRTAGDGCNTNCRIDPGYACHGSPSVCADIDECKATTAVCGNHADCRNVPGGYSCACAAGFEGDGIVCKDVDECATGADVCDANAACENEVGGYACACQSGFTGDGVSCTDVDECADPERCGEGGVCVNQHGGFECACLPGYQSVNGRCADVDECEKGEAVCSENALCMNRPGSYACRCPDGFKDDGVACVFIGEE